MKHKVRLTVIDKKLFPELQKEYCAAPDSGACPCYNIGDVFEFYRDEERDDFWHCGLNTLVRTDGDPDKVAVGPKIPIVRNYGTLFPDISIQTCRAVRS